MTQQIEPVSEEVLAEIERLQEVDQLIALPWKYDGLEIIDADGMAVCEIAQYASRAEMQLIEAACNAAPALVAEVRALRQHVKDMATAIKNEFHRGYDMGKDS